MTEVPDLPNIGSPIRSSILSNDVQSLVLPDGRALAYATYGAALKESKHPPVFYFHGHPTSRIECGLFHGAALEMSLHMIAMDRPGLGRSTYQENRTLLDWPKDVLALANRLDIEAFAVMGVSGGGPFVLACLHEIPAARLKAATIVAGAYSTKKFGTAGMLFTNRLLTWSATWSTAVVHALLELALGRTARDETNPDALYKLMRSELSSKERSDVDCKAFKQILDDPERSHLFVESLREGIKLSSKGAASEVGLFASDWRFDLENVDASRLTIWHGALDVNVPVAMADKAVELLKDVEYKRFDSEGHFSLPFNHLEAILVDLVARLT